MRGAKGSAHVAVEKCRASFSTYITNEFQKQFELSSKMKPSVIDDQSWSVTYREPKGVPKLRIVKYVRGVVL